VHIAYIASKTITLKLEAYNRLRAARRYPTESFSEVVLRATWPTGCFAPSVTTARRSPAAWIALVSGSRNATEKQTILRATPALVCTVFGGVFQPVRHICRMAHRLLTAIEIAARRD
jgi:hypothetical protein